MYFRKRSTHPNGATTVEFALVLPIFFLFLFASLEFMRAFNILHTADNAAYEAARRGIVPGSTAAEVEEVAREILATMQTRAATVDVTPSVIEPTTAEVTVDISIAMNQNAFITSCFFADHNIEVSMTMTRESFSQSSAP